MAGKYAELYDHEWSFSGTIIYKWWLAHLQSLIGGVDEKMPFEGVDLIDLTFFSLEYNHYHLVI